MTKLKKSNCDKTQKPKLKKKNSKTQSVAKLKNSNCDKTQQLLILTYFRKNKPAAQAAGADPPR